MAKGIKLRGSKSLKKLPGAQHLVDTLSVIAASGNFVSCARMAYIFYRPAQYFQAFV
jgi:hypothetical protein